MKFVANEQATKTRRSAQPEQIILFSVSNQIFAIAANAVQEIRSTDSLSGSAHGIDCPAVPNVQHTIERARQTYYVVNAALHFALPVSRPTLALILRQLRVAVLVDRIEGMAEISAVYPLPRVFIGEERRWYQGLIYIDDRVVPMVQPEGFLTAQDLSQLEEIALGKSSHELEGAARQ